AASPHPRLPVAATRGSDARCALGHQRGRRAKTSALQPRVAARALDALHRGRTVHAVLGLRPSAVGTVPKGASSPSPARALAITSDAPATPRAPARRDLRRRDTTPPGTTSSRSVGYPRRSREIRGSCNQAGLEVAGAGAWPAAGEPRAGDSHLGAANPSCRTTARPYETVRSRCYHLRD